MSEKFSYSKLDTFKQCPLKFKFKYEDKKRSNKRTLALELGEIAHKGKELVSQSLIRGEKPDYAAIEEAVRKGYKNDQDQRSPLIKGTEELKKEYFFDWAETDTKSGLTYEQKLKIYFDGLREQERDEVWKPLACEVPFSFSFGKYLFEGFIDEVDTNSGGNLRIVDYKSSKKVFDESDVKTPLQMIVYDHGAEAVYGKIPVEHIYDFIFLGVKQPACSKGYMARGEKKLNQLFGEIEDCRKTGVYTPAPSPLCHWCDYCNTNPNADNACKGECRYYSLWTPNNKVYEVNQKFVPNSTPAKTFWF